MIAILEHNNYQEKVGMAVALENYALVLKKTGRAPEATAVFARAREIRTKN